MEILDKGEIMIDKEKLTKLCESYACNILHGDSIIEEWLEKNQPEPVVVGLSDEQSLKLAEYICFYTQNKNTDYKWLIDAWLSKQTFAHPDKLLERQFNLAMEELEHLKSQQQKPSWDDAPEWANWLAQNEDGTWFWFEEKPVIPTDGFFTNGRNNLRSEPVFSNTNWQQTLEQRPKPTRQVEVGQVWKSVKLNVSAEIVDLKDDDCIVVWNDFLGRLEIKKDDFLAKFERVGGSE